MQPATTYEAYGDLQRMAFSAFFQATMSRLLLKRIQTVSRYPFHSGGWSIIPSGKRLQFANYGKSPYFFMGKSTISMAIFNGFLCVCVYRWGSFSSSVVTGKDPRFGKVKSASSYFARDWFNDRTIRWDRSMINDYNNGDWKVCPQTSGDWKFKTKNATKMSRCPSSLLLQRIPDLPRNHAFQKSSRW